MFWNCSNLVALLVTLKCRPADCEKERRPILASRNKSPTSKSGWLTHTHTHTVFPSFSLSNLSQHLISSAFSSFSCLSLYEPFLHWPCPSAALFLPSPATTCWWNWSRECEALQAVTQPSKQDRRALERNKSHVFAGWIPLHCKHQCLFALDVSDRTDDSARPLFVLATILLLASVKGNFSLWWHHTSNCNAVITINISLETDNGNKDSIQAVEPCIQKKATYIVLSTEICSSRC